MQWGDRKLFIEIYFKVLYAKVKEIQQKGISLVEYHNLDFEDTMQPAYGCCMVYLCIAQFCFVLFFIWTLKPFGRLFAVYNIFLLWHSYCFQYFLVFGCLQPRQELITTSATKKRWLVISSSQLSSERYWGTHLLTWTILERSLLLTRSLYQACHQETAKHHTV